MRTLHGMSRRTFATQSAAVTAAVGLAACGAAGQQDAAGVAPAGPPKELTLMMAKGDVVTTGQKLIPLLNERNLGFRLEPVIYKDTEELVAKAVAGDTSDLVLMEITSVPLKFNAGFVQLDNYLKRDKDLKEDEFSAGVMNFGRFGGKTWALPAVTGGINLYYNKAVFDGAGVKYPTDTWTWDDLFDAARKLTKGEGDDKVYGGPMAVVHVPTLNGWLARSGGGVFDEKENVVLDRAETIAGLQAYTDLIQRHRVSATADELMYRPRDDPKFSPWSDYVGQFRKNKLAMFVLGDHGRTSLAKATDMTAGWDYVMLPAVKAGLPPKTPATGTINGILRNSKNPDAAYLALRQLSMRDIQLALVEDGRVPILKAALNHPSFMNFGGKNNKIYLQRQYIPGNRDVPGGGDWESQVTPDLTGLLDGKFTAKAFVDKQTPILKQLRAKYDQKK